MNSTDLDQMLNNIIIEVNSIISAIQSYNQKEINDVVTDRKHLELFEFLTDLEHIFKTSKRILKFVLSNKYKSINDDTNDTTNNSGGGGSLASKCFPYDKLEAYKLNILQRSIIIVFCTYKFCLIIS